MNSCFAEFALNEFTATKLGALLEDPNEHVIVSENEDGLDGFIRITRGKAAPVTGCSTLETSTLYVQPRHHGRGLGMALLEQGLKYAQSTDAASVWLTTNSENTPAISFYLRRALKKSGQHIFAYKTKHI